MTYILNGVTARLRIQVPHLKPYSALKALLHILKPCSTLKACTHFKNLNLRLRPPCCASHSRGALLAHAWVRRGSMKFYKPPSGLRRAEIALALTGAWFSDYQLLLLEKRLLNSANSPRSIDKSCSFVILNAQFPSGRPGRFILVSPPYPRRS